MISPLTKIFNKYKNLDFWDKFLLFLPFVLIILVLLIPHLISSIDGLNMEKKILNQNKKNIDNIIKENEKVITKLENERKVITKEIKEIDKEIEEAYEKNTNIIAKINDPKSINDLVDAQKSLNERARSQRED